MQVGLQCVKVGLKSRADGAGVAIFAQDEAFLLNELLKHQVLLQDHTLYRAVVLIRYNKFRKKKRHGLQKSGRMKLRHAILKGDNKPCPKRLYS